MPFNCGFSHIETFVQPHCLFDYRKLLFFLESSELVKQTSINLSKPENELKRRITSTPTLNHPGTPSYNHSDSTTATASDCSINSKCFTPTHSNGSTSTASNNSRAAHRRDSTATCIRNKPNGNQLPLHTVDVMLAKLTNSSRYFKCKSCHKRFKRPHHLAEHLHQHKGIKSLSCKICDRRFSSPVNLKRHVVAEHPDVMELMKKCFYSNGPNNSNI